MSHFAAAFEITADDVQAAARRLGVEISMNRADDLLGEIDCDEATAAALDGGTDMDEQTDAAHAQIAEQLRPLLEAPTAG
jgi:hypothetical protein